MLPGRYPAGGRSIGIEIKGSIAHDGEDGFWAHEPANLRQQFETLVKSQIAQREINHLSVFALGPIPLLIELGRLLCDIVTAEVYQLHREPESLAVYVACRAAGAIPAIKTAGESDSSTYEPASARTPQPS